jgi:pimeloyl-ACP methyl ester carboxylesterase
VVLGSSGGAVTGLALVTRHPGQVRVLVAHEPPLAALLPDRDQVRAAMGDAVAAFHAGRPGEAWARFAAAAGFTAAPTSGAERAPARPAPPAAQEAANGTRMMRHGMIPIISFEPDLAALRASTTRIVPGTGRDSAGQLAYRGSVELARELGVPTVEFPGGHVGFIEAPPEFAEVLRGVLQD